jgi:hypothetical protein
MRDAAGSTATPAARCKNLRRGGLMASAVAPLGRLSCLRTYHGHPDPSRWLRRHQRSNLRQLLEVLRTWTDDGPAWPLSLMTLTRHNVGTIRETGLWTVPRGARNQSAFVPESLTTLAHFSVSLAKSLAKSAGEPGSGVPPSSAIRAFILGSAKAALSS